MCPRSLREVPVTYAIIRAGGKQYRVSEGERLLVDRLKLDEGATFSPDVLFVGGDGNGAGATVAVTARVVAHTLGPKIRIGKYRKRTGYRRHTGHRSKFSEIEIQAIGASKSGRSRSAPKEAPPEQPPATEPAVGGALPDGYADMTVAQINEQSKAWSAEQLEAALAFERDHGARKGAIAALESALARNEEDN
jgi:large subunit ribosomal protein L21